MTSILGYIQFLESGKLSSLKVEH
ncbi:hypothetical protein [Aneurinibacillus migulanus]